MSNSVCSVRIFEENGEWLIEQCGHRYPAPFPLTDRCDDLAEYTEIFRAFYSGWVSNVAHNLPHLSPNPPTVPCCRREAALRRFAAELWYGVSSDPIK